jgi:hypothetical protein
MIKLTLIIKEQNKVNSRTFNKVFVGLTFFMVLFFVFNLGFDAAKANGKEAVIDGIQTLFWLFAFVLFSKLNREGEKLDEELDKAKSDLDESLEKLLSTLKKEHDELLAPRKKFVDLFKEVTGVDFFDAKTVSVKHATEIEKRYHESTGKYANIIPKANGVIGVEISDKPFVKTRKKSVVKKTLSQIPKPVTTKKGK